jgi:predicted kinase
MIKIIFILAITFALESSYLMFNVNNWICGLWALASIPWVLLANYLYDNGIGKINKYITPRNGLENIKYNIKTIITNHEYNLKYIKEVLVAKNITSSYKGTLYDILKYNADNIFEAIINKMGIKCQKLKNNKQEIVIVMRGIPGSGKSKLSEIFASMGALICSTDSYHIDKITGEYKFDRENLGHYHQCNYEQFCKYIDEDKGMIIVDNTNFKPSLYRDYVEYAKENNYKVITFTFKPHADIEFHMKRNIHNVPIDTLKHMHKVMLDNLDTIEGIDYNYIVEVK